MRSQPATAILAFVLGAAVAGAGTASAAKLITGRDIKNGSITAKDLSPGLRAQLAKKAPAGERGEPGAKGDKGDKGDPGEKGDPGLTLFTFANSFVYAGRPLTNADTVVTSTAQQLPDAGGGGAGGPITIPGGGKVVMDMNVAITTQGSGTYECALQVSANGGAYFDSERPPATSDTQTRFQVRSGSFTNANPVTLQFRVVCKGAATRSVVDATFTLLGGAAKLA